MSKLRKSQKDMGGSKRELLFKEDGQIYGVVEDMLGNNRVRVKCTDLETRVCTIRGNMRKRVWICKGDWVLVSLREFESRDNKGDVIHKYTSPEVRQLVHHEEIVEDHEDHTDVVFEEEEYDIDDI